MSSRVESCWEGQGLHTGTPCRVRVSSSPLPGIRFFFADGRSFLVQEALAEGSGRGSTLSFPNGITIRTVEHLLSALAGLGAWNVEIRVDGEEIPSLDGGAAEFAGKLAVFAKTEDSCVLGPEPLRIEAPVSVRLPGEGRSLVVLPAETLGMTCVIDYPESWIGTQVYHRERFDAETFTEEIARARTFCLDFEIEALRAAGLGKGGTLENTVVIGKDGPLNPDALVSPDGCVRHKVLDLIGDLALLGRPLIGHVLAFRSGHALHLSLVSRLRRLANGGKQGAKPKEEQE